MSLFDDCSVLIPARGGSVRLPGKNLRRLAGVPLVDHTIQFSTNIGVSNVIVSSDSEDILSVVRKHKGTIAHLRSKSLSSDNVSSVEVAKELTVRNVLEGNLVLLFQPTSPFRNRNTIEKAVALARQTKQNVAAVSKYKHGHPAWSLAKSDNGDIRLQEDFLLGQQSQDLPDAFFLNGNFYIYHRKNLLSGDLGPEFTLGYPCDDDFEAIDIDTEFDLLVAQRLYRDFTKK